MLEAIIGLLVGSIASGSFVYVFLNKKFEKDLVGEQQKIEKALKVGQDEVKILFDENKKRMDEEKKEIEIKSKKVEELENKLVQKEDKLEQKLEEIEKQKEELVHREQEMEMTKQNLKDEQEKVAKKLEEISGLSKEEAKEILIKQTEQLYEKDFLSLIEKKKNELKFREKEITREIIVNSMQQYAGDVTADVTQTNLHLESDDLKGKIIGKEGRNITTFEKVTGVSLIIDDSPDTVFLSSFDLFRRYVAKKSLEQLIEDKRIQPARIEEIVEQNQRDAEKLIYDIGTQIITEMGVTDLPDEIISLIGKLRFRTSYGQNVLKHSQEVAYISEAIAEQVGADARAAYIGGLLHDIGKSVDHDIEGTHPEIGGKIARKYNLSEKIINMIEGHHDDIPATCIETKIILIADTISAIRPGARRTSVDQYIKRLKEMENLVIGFEGVSKAYALSAGREIRVFVEPSKITDIEAEKMAKDIANSIQENLSYPGEVKVNLIREKRITEYAR
ncbi:MAG: ribonuclease Y [Candidatus Gracilibacteria bacterium]|nr:ribonuclease Y [Candidatus Gracilibacteria bacterium]